MPYALIPLLPSRVFRDHRPRRLPGEGSRAFDRRACRNRLIDPVRTGSPRGRLRTAAVRDLVHLVDVRPIGYPYRLFNRSIDGRHVDSGHDGQFPGPHLHHRIHAWGTRVRAIFFVYRPVYLFHVDAGDGGQSAAAVRILGGRGIVLLPVDRPLVRAAQRLYRGDKSVSRQSGG